MVKKLVNKISKATEDSEKIKSKMKDIFIENQKKGAEEVIKGIERLGIEKSNKHTKEMLVRLLTKMLKNTGEELTEEFIANRSKKWLGQPIAGRLSDKKFTIDKFENLITYEGMK